MAQLARLPLHQWLNALGYFRDQNSQWVSHSHGWFQTPDGPGFQRRHQEVEEHTCLSFEIDNQDATRTSDDSFEMDSQEGQTFAAYHSQDETLHDEVLHDHDKDKRNKNRNKPKKKRTEIKIKPRREITSPKIEMPTFRIQKKK